MGTLLEDIRTEYPVYNEWTDLQLSNALYDKFGEKQDKTQFLRDIGIGMTTTELELPPRNPIGPSPAGGTAATPAGDAATAPAGSGPTSQQPPGILQPAAMVTPGLGPTPVLNPASPPPAEGAELSTFDRVKRMLAEIGPRLEQSTTAEVGGLIQNLAEQQPLSGFAGFTQGAKPGEVGFRIKALDPVYVEAVRSRLGDEAAEQMREQLATDPIADFGAWMTQAALDELRGLEHHDAERWERWVNTAAVSVGQAAPGMAAAFATRNPNWMPGSFGVLAYGDAYGRARAAGLPPERAQAHATLSGLLEGGTEYLPAVTLFKVGSKGFQALLSFYATELVGENIAEVGQRVSETIVGMSPDITGREFLDILIDTSAATTIGATVQGGTVASIGEFQKRLAERGAEKQREAVRAGAAEAQAVAALDPNAPAPGTNLNTANRDKTAAPQQSPSNQPDTEGQPGVLLAPEKSAIKPAETENQPVSQLAQNRKSPDVPRETPPEPASEAQPAAEPAPVEPPATPQRRSQEADVEFFEELTGGIDEASQPAEAAAQGAPATAFNPDGSEVEVQYQLVDVNQPIASHDADGNVNPEFASDQPRDRSRAAMRQWITETASPERFQPGALVDSNSTGEGAPILDNFGQVESGNGRVLLLRQLYGDGNGRLYKQYLLDNAGRFGLEREQIDSMIRPMLVRRRTTPMNTDERRRFVLSANKPAVAGFSPSEQANSDADLVTMGIFNPSADGNVLAASNQPFIRSFLQELPASERAALSTAEGQPTRQLAERLRAAVFAKAYQSDELLALSAEEASPDIRNILTGLTAAAGTFAQARDSGGGSFGELDVVTPLTEAIEIVRDARRRNQNVREAVAQGGLFEQVDANAARLAVFVSDNMRSGKRLGEAFRAIAEIVDHELVFADQGELLASEPVTVGKAIERGIKKAEEAADTADLFSVREPFFHGTGARFDRFSLDQVGTGEGAQAFGWGLYFAQDPGVAGHYQRQLGAPRVLGDPDDAVPVGVVLNGDLYRPDRQGAMDWDLPTNELAAELFQAGYSRAQGVSYNRAISIANEGINEPGADPRSVAALKEARDYINWMWGERQSVEPFFGAVYEVDIPESEVAKMLDWDAPLSEQSRKAVRRAFGNVKTAKTDNGYAVTFVNEDGVGTVDYSTLAATPEDAALNFDRHIRLMKGANVYAQLSNRFGGDEAASMALKDAGIPGIKYFDGSSRGAQGGTRNVVVFDEDIIKITAVDGKPVDDTPEVREPLLSERDAILGTDEQQLEIDFTPVETQADAPQLARAQSASAEALQNLQSSRTVQGREAARALAEGRTADIVGATVTSTADLAILAQRYRDPRFETLRVIFTGDNDEVIAQMGLTQRLPASAAAFIGNDFRAFWERIFDRAADAKATGFYLLHNHPSGESMPSNADEFVTKKIAELANEQGRFPAFLGHVVVDTNNWSEISSYEGSAHQSVVVPVSTRHEQDFGATDEVREGGLVTGRQITSPRDVAELFSQTFHEVGDFSTVFVVLSNRNQVRNVTSLHNSELDMVSLPKLRRMLLRTVLDSQGNQVIAVGRDRATLHRLKGFAIDALVVLPNGRYDSMAATVPYGGSLFPGDRVARVSADTTSQFDYLRELSLQERQLKGRFRGVREGVADMPRSPARRRQNAYTRVAQKVIDAWNNWVGWRYSVLKRLPNQRLYLAMRQRTLGRITNTRKIAESIYDTFSSASKADQVAVYAYLTTAGAKAEGIADLAVRQKAIDTKGLIDKTGRALVRLGLLSADAYDRHRDAYLPRLYLKHLLDENGARLLGAGKTPSSLAYLKHRKDIPKDVREVLLGEVTDPGFLASVGLARTQRDIALLEFFESIAFNKDWVHGAHLIKFETGRGRPRTVSVFWLQQEAAALRTRSKLYEPGPRRRAEAAAEKMEQTVAEHLRDHPVESGDLDDFKQVPQSPRYGMLGGIWLRKEIYNDIVGMAGAMSSEATWAEKLFGYGGIGTKLNQFFKLNKVALNPPTQIRNFTSNMILVHLSGTPMLSIPGLYARAIDELLHDAALEKAGITGKALANLGLKGREGKYFKIAKKYGIFESTFSVNELLEIRREWHDLALRSATGPMETGRRMAAKLVSTVGRKASDVYQISETIGKMAKIIDAMEREGMSEADAVIEANKWLFDYSFIPRSVQFLRNAPIGAPFLTFSYKALPRVVETLVLRPWKFAPYYLMSESLMWAAAMAQDVDREDVKKLTEFYIAPWLRDRSLVAPLPFKDSAGKWQVVDLGWLFPWGMFSGVAGQLKRDLAEVPDQAAAAAEGGGVGDAALAGAGQTLKAIGAVPVNTGLYGGPIPNLLAAIPTNIDPFTQRPVIDKDAPAGEQFRDIMNYSWRMLAPTWLTDIGFLGKRFPEIFGTGPLDRRTGEPKMTDAQAWMRLIGANVYPIEPAEQRRENILRMKFEERRIQRALADKLNDQNMMVQPDMSAEEKRRVMAERADIKKVYKAIVEQKRKDRREYEKLSKLPENLR